MTGRSPRGVNRPVPAITDGSTIRGKGTSGDPIALKAAGPGAGTYGGGGNFVESLQVDAKGRVAAVNVAVPASGGTSLFSDYEEGDLTSSGGGGGQVVVQYALPVAVNGDSAIAEVRGTAGSTVAAAMKGKAAIYGLKYNGSWGIDSSADLGSIGGSVATLSVDISGGNFRLLIDDGTQIHRVSGAIGIRFAQ